MTLEQKDTIVAKFDAVDTSIITDAFLRLGLSGWMDGVLPLVPGQRIAARARTLSFRPIRNDGHKGRSMYSIIGGINAGEILVMGAGGTHDNLMGDNMGTFAQLSGLAGVVTDSRTRDRAGLRDLGLPVFSCGGAVRPPTHVEIHETDVTISCGGAQVRPGDIIVADDDGVVVVPANRAEDVLYQIEELTVVEARLHSAIVAGATVKEIESIAAEKKRVRA